MKTEVRKTCAAIMFSDIVGYTAMMGRDEEMAYQMVKRNVRIHQQVIKKYHGKLVKEMGDGILSSYPSGREAIAAALELQQYYFKSKELSLRIGVHFGEIIEDAHDVFGDAVNIASRLQTLGHPNSVLFSKSIKEDIANDPSFPFVDLGKFHLKNVDENVEIFALANEGLAVPKRGDLAKLLESRVKKFVTGGFIFASISLIVMLIYHFGNFGTNSIAFPPTLAILPIDYSGENEQLGMNIRNDLYMIHSYFPELFVSPKARTDLYEGINPTKTVFDELNVNFLISGRIVEDKQTNHFQVKLWAANSTNPVWEQDYEFNTSNLLQIEGDIARNVASKIGIPLTEKNIYHIENWRNSSASAHEHYQRGKEFYVKYSLDALPKAISEFRQAIKIDPKSSLAWSGLADAYSLKYYLTKSERIWIDSAITCSLFAIKLDSNSAEGYKSLAVTYNYQGKYDKALELNNKALEINPYFHQAIGNKASNLFSLGDLPQALHWQSVASGYNPNLYIPYQNMGWAHRLLGNYDLAISYLNKSIERTPARETYEQLALTYLAKNEKDLARAQIPLVLQLIDTVSYSNLDEKTASFEDASKILETAGIISFFVQDFDSAKGFLSRSIKIHPNIANDVWAYAPIYLAFIFTKDGDNIEAENLLNASLHLHLIEINNETQDTEFYFNTAAIYAIKGDQLNALKFLNLAASKKWVDRFKIDNNPMFDQLRDNPATKRILSSIQSEITRMNKEIMISK
ncbi:adenylate/guanylate cyclase domain-containing protein [Mariniradius saccharolyticus]|uniref:adenylate/guanylate cyclase domain-containing protein n=1 Tax=Mariniradius saccharolyticus TaxID=1245591 RepID=UPI000309E356|nr:adenylate/guanylate cyclase domain-containing protein [Mariniradius saccharolyticus]